VLGATIEDGSTTGFPAEYYIYTGYRDIDFWYASNSDIISQKVHVKFLQMGTGKVELYGYTLLCTWDTTDKYVDQWVNIPAPNYRSKLTIHLAGIGVVGGYIRVDELTLVTEKRGGVSPINTAVTASAANGAVQDTGVVNVKNTDDVNPLATDNAALNINTQENPPFDR